MKYDSQRERKREQLIASGVKIPGDLGERFFRVQRRTLPSVLDRRTIEACLVEIDENDWRFPFVQYLKNPKASNSQEDPSSSPKLRFVIGCPY